MEVRLFGELEAVQDGIAVPVRGTKQRALLALLALHCGEPVSADRLIDVLWGDGQAANPANAQRTPASTSSPRHGASPPAYLTGQLRPCTLREAATSELTTCTTDPT